MHKEDVNEALRLVYVSKSSLMEQEKSKPKDAVDQIYEIFQQLYRSSKKTDIRFGVSVVVVASLMPRMQCGGRPSARRH